MALSTSLSADSSESKIATNMQRMPRALFLGWGRPWPTRRLRAPTSREGLEIKDREVFAAHFCLEHPDRVLLVIGGVASLATVAVKTELGASQTVQKGRLALGDDRFRQLGVSARTPGAFLMQCMCGQAIGYSLQILAEDRLVSSRAFFGACGGGIDDHGHASGRNHRWP